MVPQKQPININFAQGLDTKTDPKQVQVGRFLSLKNSIFTKAGLLSKRNGFGGFPALPDSSTTFLTTFQNNLTALGTSLFAYSSGGMRWVNKAAFQPISLNTLPLARSAFNQTQCDSVIAANGLICTVFTEVDNTTPTYKYVVADSVTGQNIISPTAIPVSSGAVDGSPRVFLLGSYFVIVFTNLISATSHLQYIAVSSINPSVVTANANIAASYIPSDALSWDGVVNGNFLYVAYNTTAGGQQIQITSLSTTFTLAAPVSFAGSIATIMSMCVDETGASPVIYAAFYDDGGSTGHVLAISTNLHTVLAPTIFTSDADVLNITCTAQNGSVQIAYELENSYSYDSGIQTNLLKKVAVTQAGSVGALTIFVRSVGLASKAFLLDGEMYLLAAYDGKSSGVAAAQPTYFMINLSGNVIARLAYQNGGGYLGFGLPQAQVIDSTVWCAYLFKDLIKSVNKSQGAASSSGVYSQTGVNVASFTFDSSTLSTAEIGANLNISGGMLYSYDGNLLSEQNFNLYPDSVEVTVVTSGGSMTVQDYFYVAVYEWTDAQGNAFYSATSIPVKASSGDFSGSSNSVEVDIPTLRLSYKPDVKIGLYRWSTAQQEYFQVTSIGSPLLNNPAADSVQFVDTLADADIVGNSLLYTTGGVVDDTSAPACTALTLFDTRLWAIDAEDQNLLWYSKQVIEATPVEMSNQFTKFISPNAGAQGNTGPMKCLAPMDDKLIIFKKNAIFWINGSGPDNTGANSQYSEPVFVTSTVGSTNQRSIVMTDKGLMFQSDKGIWLLARNLQTLYIGAPVEAFNGYAVNSAVCVPGTNQVRFTLSNGVILMYDYFYGEWGTFYGASGISSAIYNDLHTIVNSRGMVSQETPGTYLDNGNPVLMSFKTGPISVAGLQGFERAHFFNLLGDYLSPHKLYIQIAYEYSLSPSQALVIDPGAFSPAYGNISPYGQQSVYGGTLNKEEWRIFFTQGKVKSFQIQIDEIYDASLGVPAGAGFNLSGINMVASIKKGYFPTPASNTAGGS